MHNTPISDTDLSKIRFREKFELQDKVIIITGSTGILGKAHARALAEFGATVICTDIRKEAITTQVQELKEEFGDKHLGMILDISAEKQVIQVFQNIYDTFGKIDGLVNNASFTGKSSSPNFFSEFENFPLEDWNSVLSVSLTGSFLCSREAVKYMKKGNSGSIVNVSSIYGVVGPTPSLYEGLSFNTPAVYGAVKSGIIGLTKHLASVLGKYNIRVNTLTPGGVYYQHQEPFLSRYSEKTALGRMNQRDELSSALVFLLSAASSAMTGQNIIIDGGFTIK